ncbi:MAG TPA: YciI family protein [Polyangiaceae bacterium]|nr:YciI family protein [Polyangiaceae bacterium]
MAEYLVTTLEDEHAHASQSPKAMSELIERSAAFVDELRRAGRLKDSGRFRPSKEGKRVRRDGDRLDVRDGPFAEGGRALGSYCWVEASSVEEAAEIAARAPALPSDEIDVRPLIKGMCAKDKEAKPGKLFGCAVLGNTKTEEAWIEVMDRIDEETRGRFPEASFLGGLRLEPPRSGRRIAMRGERRATFDGPFLESKEVIGGLFLVRMRSIDEAVRWAGNTRFVVHGALEIRELWRI